MPNPMARRLGLARFVIPDNSDAVSLRGIAQLVERRSPKPQAGGSSPSAPAIFRDQISEISDQAGEPGLISGQQSPSPISAMFRHRISEITDQEVHRNLITDF